MTALTLEALVRILRESAGEDEGVDLGGDIADTAFTDLGYDSLALLETLGRVQRDYGVTLDDDLLATAQTPRQFLDAVNEVIAAGV
ncbi:acyl carrier protein [Streptomyces thermodiastaticus]|jgi:act minimal PKS acyl carrier protein|uniref:acyl carrier protein n=1 Tax=Streptomyces thermodiastaticus TaxID=44061 RepID=UPI00167BF794|nr:acyl carrier protein [Streptomyces thermodiastaticus]MCE7549829.1 acyl carrier protein [Streptomyces thermodiastaticus]GHF65826.1 actinorhodin polyketide synthase acyl carrier protein [Streptomyces thermodiastaticus]